MQMLRQCTGRCRRSSRIVFDTRGNVLTQGSPQDGSMSARGFMLRRCYGDLQAAADTAADAAAGAGAA